jgi:hypothetical protein
MTTEITQSGEKNINLSDLFYITMLSHHTYSCIFYTFSYLTPVRKEYFIPS